MTQDSFNSDHSSSFANKAIIYLLQYKSILLATFLTGALIVLGGMYFQHRKSNQLSQNYLTLIADSQRVENSPFEDHSEVLSKLEQVSKKDHTQQSHLDPVLAQTFVNQYEGKKAETYAQRSMKRTQLQDDVYYKTFNEITLLISKSNWNQALKDSLAFEKLLLQDMEKTSDPRQRSQIEVFLGYNTLQMSLLYEELQQYQRAYDENERLIHFMEKAPEDQFSNRGKEYFNQAFAFGSVDLMQFLKERRSKLLSKI